MRHRKLLGEQQPTSPEPVPLQAWRAMDTETAWREARHLHNRIRAQLPHNKVAIQNSGQTKSRSSR